MKKPSADNVSTWYCRVGKGGKYSPSTLPKEPLILWGYEPSPFTRVVRERIVELEIPHIFKTTCRGSAKRQEVFDKYGKFQAPLLEVLPHPCSCPALFLKQTLQQNQIMHGANPLLFWKFWKPGI